MFSGNLGRRSLTNLWMALAFLVLAVPAFAQTGRVQGRVTDELGKPVEGAKVVITAVPDTGGQKWEATTDRNGDYIVGTLPRSGQYQVVGQKEGIGTDEGRVAVKVGNNRSMMNLRLSNAARVSEEQAAKNIAIKKFFDTGIAAAQAGNHQGAVDAFTAATVQLPTCGDCFFNIGVSQSQMKNYDAAEAAYKKAIEINPNNAQAYNALAALYTTQRKMDLAAAASSKAAELSVAAGGGNADSLFNAGVGLWNANKFPEAQTTFEAAIKADPSYADAHFMLGKVNLNLGKLPEAAANFQQYLKLAPTGKNAPEAQTTFDALKPMLK
jgi:Tfp pilus assembly protein PilF